MEKTNIILEVIIFVISVNFFCESNVLKNEQNVFARSTTDSMKGVCMMGIILHHIRIVLNASSFVLGIAGYIGTGVFFFISGYGNELSLKKNGVSTNWLKKKIVKIYFPFLICYILWVSILLLKNSKILGKEILMDLLTISLPNMINWFPKVILVCFVLHLISFKWNKRIRLTVIILATCTYILGMKFFRAPDYWYLSVGCYPLGIFCTSRNVMIKWDILNKKRYSICLGMILVNIVLLLISQKLSFIRVFVALSFSISCFIYANIFEVKTKILAWIGKNSFSCYLFHLLAVNSLTEISDINSILYVICVINVTFLLVYVYFGAIEPSARRFRATITDE